MRGQLRLFQAPSQPSAHGQQSDSCFNARGRFRVSVAARMAGCDLIGGRPCAARAHATGEYLPARPAGGPIHPGSPNLLEEFVRGTSFHLAEQLPVGWHYVYCRWKGRFGVSWLLGARQASGFFASMTRNRGMARGSKSRPSSRVVPDQVPSRCSPGPDNIAGPAARKLAAQHQRARR